MSYHIFARNLRSLRLALGLTQKEVAQRAKLSEACIISMENERKDPTPESMYAAAKALGTTPQILSINPVTEAMSLLNFKGQLTLLLIAQKLAKDTALKAIE